MLPPTSPTPPIPCQVPTPLPASHDDLDGTAATARGSARTLPWSPPKGEGGRRLCGAAPSRCLRRAEVPPRRGERSGVGGAGRGWGRRGGCPSPGGGRAYLGFPHDVGGGARPGRRELPLPLLQPAPGRGEDAVGGAGGAAQRRGRGSARQEGQLAPGAPLPAEALLVEEGAARWRPLQRGAGCGEGGAGGRQGAPRTAALAQGAAGGPRPRRPARALAVLPAAADDGGVEAARLAEPPLGKALGGGGGGGGRGGAGEDAAQQALRRHRGRRCPGHGGDGRGSWALAASATGPRRGGAEQRGSRGVPRPRAQPPAAQPDGGTEGFMAASGVGAAPGLPPPRSLCWEGEGGIGEKKSYERKGEGRRQQRSFYLDSPQTARVTPPSAAMHRGVARRPPAPSGRWVAEPACLPPKRGEPIPLSPAPRRLRGAPTSGVRQPAAPPGCADTGAVAPWRCPGRPRQSAAATLALCGSVLKRDRAARDRRFSERSFRRLCWGNLRPDPAKSGAAFRSLQRPLVRAGLLAVEPLHPPRPCRGELVPSGKHYSSVQHTSVGLPGPGLWRSSTMIYVLTQVSLFILCQFEKTILTYLTSINTYYEHTLFYCCLTACAEQPHVDVSTTDSMDNPRPVFALMAVTWLWWW